MATTAAGDAAVDRLNKAIEAFEKIITGASNQVVDVPGYGNQPTLAGRVDQRLDETTATAAAEADRSTAQANDAANSVTLSAAEYNKAKTQADRAQSEADRAAKITGLETVSDAIGLAALPLPDVWAPLSDSLRMITGYGREVLVGSDVVARMVNYSRNSNATYTDKYGKLKAASANEPRFEKDGLLLEGQSTNLILESSVPSALIGYTMAGVIESPIIGQDANIIEYLGPSNQSSFVRFNGVLPSAATDTKTASCYVMAIGHSTSISIECEDFNTKTIMCPADTWVRISTTRTSPTTEFSNFIDVFLQSPILGQRFAVWGAQLETLPFASSTIPTNGAAVTRAADMAWIPSAGNRFISGMYAAALEFDLFGLVAGSEISYLIDFDNSGGSDRQHISINNNVQLQCVIGPSQAISVVAGKLKGVAAMRMNGLAMNVMMDGVQGSSVTASGVGLSLNNRIALMNSNMLNLPSYGHIRNIRMWSKQPISNDQLRTAV